MNRLLAFVALALTVLLAPIVHAGDNLGTQLMHCTFKITNGKVSGTGFVLSEWRDGHDPRWLLVTAAHVVEQIKEDEALLVLRKPLPDQTYEKLNHRFALRREGKPLWVKHPTQDVAVMPLALPAEVTVPRLPVELLATDEMWQRYEIQPGDTLRCIGFPHAGHFESNGAGFPLVRMGCLASFPVLPTKQTKTFLFDFNTFEGDSGGAVYLDEPQRIAKEGVPPERAQLIVGLVHGQHFIEERFSTIYQSGMTRHRLGLCIVIHATAIRETIDLLAAKQE